MPVLKKYISYIPASADLAFMMITGCIVRAVKQCGGLSISLALNFNN